ncbi:alginate lyase family protein [Dyadobacter sp. CY323]|uniref:alginate lyase family protein n=1 Tax=Dyadobacter sp. CY323 TaxID=2907302 RepID=UPI001F392B6D|nr:alginate lyase family protein [Dyadobacter sp. CY323]MCE6991089.1 alginate lyase family protein [Dyadobacter sp. CY323]
MKTFATFLIVLLCFITLKTVAQTPETPLVSIDFETLKKVRDSGKNIQVPIKKLIEKADKLLKAKPLQVVDGDTPPSGNMHDFFAIGKLAFPNPKTPNGMPYIRKDGVTNPEADGDRYDLHRYNTTLSRVNDLSLAWFYTRDEKYAKKAAELLRVWFLDPDTRMNPNLNNASALPGVHDGMPIGIIFSVALIRMVDHVKILALSKSWTTEDNKGLKKWFADYRDWLLESDLGKVEAKANNNHGSWYAAQVAAYSIYNGEFEKAKPMIDLAKKQIAQQIEPDGSMPREYKRERSLHYSIYGLQAFTYLARCGEIVGENLWDFKSADEKSLRLAFSFLYPYVTYTKEWPWKNIAKGEPLGRGVLEVYQWAAKAWPDSEFARVNPSFWKEVPAQSGDYLYWPQP